MKRVLSLDASTSTIGLSVLEYNETDIKFIHVEYFKPPKKGNLFERLSAVRLYIESKIDEFNPDFCAIEDIVLFMGGRTTAKTIIALAVLNRTVGLAIYDKQKKAPYAYNALRIRHAIKKEKALPPKEEIPELVAEILNIDFPYVFKRNKKPLVENEDMADAIAVGICHIYMDRRGVAEELQIPKKKKRKKKVIKK